MLVYPMSIAVSEVLLPGASDRDSDGSFGLSPGGGDRWRHRQQCEPHSEDVNVDVPVVTVSLILASPCLP